MATVKIHTSSPPFWRKDVWEILKKNYIARRLAGLQTVGRVNRDMKSGFFLPDGWPDQGTFFPGEKKSRPDGW
jgi:hypothetical protein